jgi:hypothetical protein
MDNDCSIKWQQYDGDESVDSEDEAAAVEVENPNRGKSAHWRTVLPKRPVVRNRPRTQATCAPSQVGPTQRRSRSYGFGEAAEQRRSTAGAGLTSWLPHLRQRGEGSRSRASWQAAQVM